MSMTQIGWFLVLFMLTPVAVVLLARLQLFWHLFMSRQHLRIVRGLAEDGLEARERDMVARHLKKAREHLSSAEVLRIRFQGRR